MEDRSEKDRMHEIVSVFLKHGIGKGLISKNIPVSLRESFEELGPTFIKIGQILSMRSDLLPETYIEEFQKLQDEVKCERFDEIKKVIEGGLKKPICDVFIKFECEPIASASIAQVHLAYLKNYEKVVVKVQRPRAKETMMSDISILKRLTNHLKHTSLSKILNLKEIITELENSVKKEMDFLNEAENIKKFYKNNLTVKYITCPIVYDEFTKYNLLVMSYIDGIKISDTGKLLSEGYDLNELGLKLANNYFKQIFEDGFFHADPHPGNIIINNNKIVYIDFGMMGALNSYMKNNFNDFLFGLIAGDIHEMTQAVLNICTKSNETNIKDLNSDIEDVYDKYIETSLNDVNLNELTNDIFKACRKNHLLVPSEITMLVKGIITIEGVLEKLSPSIKITQMVLPYVKNQIFKNMDIKSEINNQLLNFFFIFKSLPKISKELTKLINNASSGKINVQMDHINLEIPLRRINRMVNRVVFSIIIAAIIIGSSMIVSTEIGPQFYGVSMIALTGYVGALLMGIWLLILILKSGM